MNNEQTAPVVPSPVPYNWTVGSAITDAGVVAVLELAVPVGTFRFFFDQTQGRLIADALRTATGGIAIAKEL